MKSSNRLYELSRPVIFAHRGASRYAPENTLAAFSLAVQQGAEAVELDAKLTADGQIVVFHDQTLARTTKAAGKIQEKTLAELKRLDAGSHFDQRYQSEPIPTLGEVFEAVGNRAFINVELTNYAAPFDDLPQKVAYLVRLHKLERGVMMSSFNPIALIKTKRLLPEVPIGLLAFEGKRGFWTRSWIGTWLDYDALHPEVSDVQADIINRVHTHNRRVHTYTVNDPDVMKRLFDLEIDGIFTDDPPLAMQVFRDKTH
jgi:glycerophosphoryl diester phosphodiesterase